MRFYRISCMGASRYADITDWEGDTSLMTLAVAGKLDEATEDMKLTGIIQVKKELPDFLDTWANGDVVSGRFKRIAESVASYGIHFRNLPIRLEKEGGRIVYDYYFMCFTSAVDTDRLIDLERSDITYASEEDRRTRNYRRAVLAAKYVLASQHDIPYDFFELRGPRHMIISETLYDWFMVENISNIKYTLLQ